MASLSGRSIRRRRSESAAVASVALLSLTIETHGIYSIEKEVAPARRDRNLVARVTRTEGTALRV
jgi:hypothetical protein